MTKVSRLSNWLQRDWDFPGPLKHMSVRELLFIAESLQTGQKLQPHVN